MAAEYLTLWGESAPLPKWAAGKRSRVASPGETAEARMDLRAERVKLEDGAKPKRKPVNAANREMVGAYGAGPVGATCGGCAHLYRVKPGASEYLKCDQHGETRGPGTDHRASWPACGRFEPRPRTLIPPVKTRGKIEVPCATCGAPLVLRAWYPNDRNYVVCGATERDQVKHEVFTRQHCTAVTVDADRRVTKVEVAW